jgi:hypothetical protein
MRPNRDDVPVAAYAGIMLFFAAAAGTLLRRAAEKKALPERIAAEDIALLGVATHRLTRIVTRDRVATPLRLPFTELEGSAGGGEVDEKPRGQGLRKAIGTLLTCPYCAGPWIATGLTTALLARPRETRVAASMLAMVTVADFLHQSYALMRQASR